MSHAKKSSYPPGNFEAVMTFLLCLLCLNRLSVTLTQASPWSPPAQPTTCGPPSTA